MSDKSLDPRIAALWIVHGRACADLLRANGRQHHAENYEAAMDELMRILAAEIGRARLASALDWVSDRLWSDRASAETLPIKH